MAPKRKAKVVKTTKKVVQETVEVTLIEKDQKLAAEAENGVETQQQESESEVVKTTVTVEDKLAEESEQVTVEIPVQQPPQKETATEAPRTPRQPEAKDKTQRQKTAQEAKKDRREQEDVETKNQPKRAREVYEKARGGRRRRRRRVGEGGGEEQYKRYMFRVLKQVHPGLGISSAAMEVLNGYMNDMFERLAAEAARLSSYAGIKTLSSRDIQGAVRLVLPGELGRHAIAEGAKAVTNYMEHDGGGGGGAKSKP